MGCFVPKIPATPYPVVLTRLGCVKMVTRVLLTLATHLMDLAQHPPLRAIRVMSAIRTLAIAYSHVLPLTTIPTVTYTRSAQHLHLGFICERTGPC